MVMVTTVPLVCNKIMFTQALNVRSWVTPLLNALAVCENTSLTLRLYFIRVPLRLLVGTWV